MPGSSGELPFFLQAPGIKPWPPAWVESALTTEPKIQNKILFFRSVFHHFYKKKKITKTHPLEYYGGCLTQAKVFWHEVLAVNLSVK